MSLSGPALHICLRYPALSSYCEPSLFIEIWFFHGILCPMSTAARAVLSCSSCGSQSLIRSKRGRSFIARTIGFVLIAAAVVGGSFSLFMADGPLAHSTIPLKDAFSLSLPWLGITACFLIGLAWPGVVLFRHRTLVQCRACGAVLT